MVKVFQLIVDDTAYNAEIYLGIFSSLKQAKAVAKATFETQPEWEYDDLLASYVGHIPDSKNVGHDYTLSISVWELDDESVAKEYKDNFLGEARNLMGQS